MNKKAHRAIIDKKVEKLSPIKVGISIVLTVCAMVALVIGCCTYSKADPLYCKEEVSAINLCFSKSKTGLEYSQCAERADAVLGVCDLNG